MLTTILSAAALVAFAAFAFRRSLTYLRYFQQDEYDAARFVKWLFVERALDTRASLGTVVAFAAGFLLATSPHVDAVQYAMLAVAFAAVAILEGNPLKAGKKKLALTPRAVRTLTVALVLTLGLAVALQLLFAQAIVWLVPIHFVPFSLALATIVLAPFESRIQARYWREAHDILGKLKPVVVGITGSYGKTSTKHLLGHILSAYAPTLVTPGSVNTAMGIARVVRERLTAQHRFFVVEMGAYGRGSIERLCALAPPTLGILTTIGKAHYERFRSVDDIAAAKLELAEATRRNGGQTIFGPGAVRHSLVAQYATANTSIVVSGGATPDGARIVKVTETRDGISIVVEWQGQEHTLAVTLYGGQQVENIVLAFVAACVLGVPPGLAAKSLVGVPQLEHRLEVKHVAGGATIIDDAYNSNPEGFASALRLLDMMRKPGGRRILVTPGMVELGEIEGDEHAKIGRLAGSCADVLLAVVPHRIETLISSYCEANNKGLVEFCATFGDAQRWLAINTRPDDVVLLENDLPDLYELKPRI